MCHMGRVYGRVLSKQRVVGKGQGTFMCVELQLFVFKKSFLKFLFAFFETLLALFAFSKLRFSLAVRSNTTPMFYGG